MMEGWVEKQEVTSCGDGEDEGKDMKNDELVYDYIL